LHYFDDFDEGNEKITKRVLPAKLIRYILDTGPKMSIRKFWLTQQLQRRRLDVGLLWLPLCAVFFASSLTAGVINFQVSNLGLNSYRYTYVLTGSAFLTNQELDIQFDPALYSALSNGIAGSGFNLILLQPNNPPGLFGDYSVLALIDNPSLAGPFSVDFTFLGPGQPGAQPYSFNQLDANHKIVRTIESGTTGIPEPASFWLGCMGLLVVFVKARSWRRSPANRNFRR
jgi:hypothetical protein